MNLAGIPQHIIHRVNFSFKCFYKTEDLQYYLECLKDASTDAKVSVHAYALMSDHVHLLVSSDDGDKIPHMMRLLGRHYTHYFNRKYYRKGSLWRERIRPCLIDADNYLLACQRYIELSPVRAGHVKHPAEYVWSSYSVNALGEHSGLLTPHPVYQALGLNRAHRNEIYRQMFSKDLEPSLIEKISEHSDYGYCLGSDNFKHEIKTILGRRIREENPGGPARTLQLRSCNY